MWVIFLVLLPTFVFTYRGSDAVEAEWKPSCELNRAFEEFVVAYEASPLVGGKCGCLLLRRGTVSSWFANCSFGTRLSLL